MEMQNPVFFGSFPSLSAVHREHRGQSGNRRCERAGHRGRVEARQTRDGGQPRRVHPPKQFGYRPVVKINIKKTLDKKLTRFKHYAYYSQLKNAVAFKDSDQIF